MFVWITVLVTQVSFPFTDTVAVAEEQPQRYVQRVTYQCVDGQCRRLVEVVPETVQAAPNVTIVETNQAPVVLSRSSAATCSNGSCAPMWPAYRPRRFWGWRLWR